MEGWGSTGTGSSAGANTPAGGGRYLVMEGTPMLGGRHGGLATSTSSPGSGAGVGGQGQMVVHAMQPKTLNEMEAELQQLQRENFDLKMAIFYQKVSGGGIGCGCRWVLLGRID